MAYVLLWYPLFTQPFIFREVEGLKNLLPLSVYSLYGPNLRHCSTEMRATAKETHTYGLRALGLVLSECFRQLMLHSLEVRAPFLDKDAAEFAARLPVSRKLHGFKRKWLLKTAFADLLPKEILHRNKRGFQIPVAQWLRGRLRPLMEDLLCESALKAQGIFNPLTVRALMDRHISGQADLRKPLWTLLVFQLWWRARHN